MRAWHIDDGAYRDTFLKCLKQAEHIGELANSLSVPGFCALTEEYIGSDQRLLILGQETFGSYNPVGRSKIWDAYTSAIGGFVAFDYAEGGEPRQRRTPFWQAFRESCGHAGVPAPRGAAWSNLVKVQVVGRSEPSVLSLSADDQHKMLDWTCELFHAELRFVAPKRILCFTGPNYDWILQRMIPDLQLSSVAGFTRNELMVGRSPSFGFTIARTYHPQYLVRSTAECAATTH